VERTDADVLIAEERGPVTVLTINRPEARNALDRAVLEALDAAVARCDGDETRAIVITGAGEKAFSAGADLDELAELDASAARRLLEYGQGVLRRVEIAPVPVIAAVDGWALGGGFELALSCAFILASTRARFGLPEVRLGLMPGYGGTQRLRRAVGPQNARRLCLTGIPVDAARAYELGLLSEPPLDPERLLPAAEEVAQAIAANGPEAVRLILEASRADEFPGGPLGHERALAAIAIGSAEGAEGIDAFRSKRQPRFARA
jgi:enoyl-CoA hydratase